jgi:predicted pyridoxine 5'-phosphate oxidase superfamily flavin-nucleotide-binding protein
MINPDIKILAEQSVLCWLATANPQGIPSVSPKEVFTIYEDNSIIIANIASPNSARNIRSNPHACVSFINIFTQKGYQIQGRASCLTPDDPTYAPIEQLLTPITQGIFPFSSVFQVMIDDVREIIAPRYRLFPDTTEQDQIRSAMETYAVRPLSP